MDSPLQIFRELLPFGQNSAEQKSAAAVRGLLDTVAGLSPQETVAKLASSVLPTVGQQPNLHMRFKLLEDIRHECEQALPTLEQDINQAVLPLPFAVTTAALHADNLLKGLSIAYAGIARGINKSQLESGLSHLFHRSVQRAMAMIARRQLLAYRAYAAPSATSWQCLHDLFQLVRGPLSTPLNGETAPIEHEYLGALLFAYLEPSKLPRSELEIINLCSRQLAAYAVIGDALADPGAVKHPDSCFLVRPEEGTPGYPLSRLPASTSTFGGLLVDCSPVLAALDRNITRRPGKNVEPDLNAAPAILQSLRVAIGGRSSRRFSRTHFRPRGDLVAGLATDTLRLLLQAQTGHAVCADDCQAPSHDGGAGALLVLLRQVPPAAQGGAVVFTSQPYAYGIYDPLAPNWTIKEQAIDAETYRLSLRAKHFRVGGDGEFAE